MHSQLVASRKLLKFAYLLEQLQGIVISGVPGRNQETFSALDIVLRSQVRQYCELIQCIEKSLSQLQLALSGAMGMTPFLQRLAHDIIIHKVCSDIYIACTLDIHCFIPVLARPLAH